MKKKEEKPKELTVEEINAACIREIEAILNKYGRSMRVNQTIVIEPKK